MNINSTAHIISVGDEILLGQIVNTNSSFIAGRLSEIGVYVSRIITVSDEREDILWALNESSSRCGIIIITGGLGPTSDDVTRPVLAEYMGARLTRRQDILEKMERRFSARETKMPESAEIQAEFPEGATPIKNEYGTAPGIFFRKGELLIFAAPGVPPEMKGMLEDFIVPLLINEGRGGHHLYRIFRTAGKGESSLSEIIGDWPFEDVKLAYLPKYYGVDLRITADSDSHHDAEAALDVAEVFLRGKIGDFIYGTGEVELSAVIGGILRDNNWKLATAESCTGGMLTSMIVEQAGASDYFQRGYITYSDEAKAELLNVPAELITEHGAVSLETAEAMARGAAAAAGADFALSVTGIAGPSGGTPSKPVGLTYIAVAHPKGVEAKKFIFQGDRSMNRKRSVRAALNLLYTVLKNYTGGEQ